MLASTRELGGDWRRPSAPIASAMCHVDSEPVNRATEWTGRLIYGTGWCSALTAFVVRAGDTGSVNSRGGYRRPRQSSGVESRRSIVCVAVPVTDTLTVARRNGRPLHHLPHGLGPVGGSGIPDAREAPRDLARDQQWSQELPCKFELWSEGIPLTPVVCHLGGNYSTTSTHYTALMNTTPHIDSRSGPGFDPRPWVKAQALGIRS